MRQNLAASLSSKFAEVLQQYQNAQNEYTDKVKAKMVQKVKIGMFPTYSTPSLFIISIPSALSIPLLPLDPSHALRKPCALLRRMGLRELTSVTQSRSSSTSFLFSFGHHIPISWSPLLSPHLLRGPDCHVSPPFLLACSLLLHLTSLALYQLTHIPNIVKPEATDNQIEKAIETGQVDKLFVQGTLDGAQLHGQAKNAMAYVTARHQDIVAIENSVRVCKRERRERRERREEGKRGSVFPPLYFVLYIT